MTLRVKMLLHLYNCAIMNLQRWIERRLFMNLKLVAQMVAISNHQLLDILYHHLF